MPEEGIFTHLGKTCYFTSGGCVKSLAREQLTGRLKDLVRPL
jgi:hypothetical protein